MSQVGNELLEPGCWEEAATAYRQSIQINPREFWSHYHLEQALSELKHWVGAETAYRQAIQINPRDTYSAFSKRVANCS